MRWIFKITVIAVLIVLISCQRKPLEEEYYTTALIPVKVLWEHSGMQPTKSEAGDFVSRVSFRFFPKDGSAPFERYLETNVREGAIEVPVGKYALLVMNESVSDPFWSDYLSFSDIDDFSKISATLNVDDPSKYDFYKPKIGEAFAVEAPKLASWSIDDFEVTSEMAQASRSDNGTTILALEADLQQLTYSYSVVATIENLQSVMTMYGAMQGFANRVFLSTRKTGRSPATTFFRFNGRKFKSSPEQTDGVTKYVLSTFGRLPIGEQYNLLVDIVFVNGSRYTPNSPNDLLFNVTDVVTNSIELNIEIPIALKLPKVDGDVGVGDWKDDETIIIK